MILKHTDARQIVFGVTIDVSRMEDLLGELLARQLAGFYEAAGGKMPN